MKNMLKSCQIDGCNLKYWAKGLCKAHYLKEDYNKRYIPHPVICIKKLCIIERCQLFNYAYGYCAYHYRRTVQYRELVKKNLDKCRRELSTGTLFKKMRENSKSRKWNLNFTFKEFECWYKYVDRICEYCRINNNDILIMTGKILGIDRKDSALPYTLRNICICCELCNRVKSSILSYEEMLIVGKIIMTPKWKLKLEVPAYGN